MDVTEQLQTYIAQLVALGQATLARRRRGEWLPDELAAPAAALLALESALSAAPTAAPGVTAMLDETVAARPPVAADAPDEPATLTGGVAVMSPIEADNWLSALDEELPSGLLILDAAAPADEPLVIDVDEGPGGGPMTAGAAGALPPLVIDPIRDLPAEGGVPEQAEEPHSCASCGATLRPGRRFCHRCGAPVAEMAAELPPATAAPTAPAAEASPPPRRATLPVEEWPTIVSDPARHAAGAPAMARFCNNCGLGLAADATICPDCGSRDIS